jgi:chromosome partitioning protein
MSFTDKIKDLILVNNPQYETGDRKAQLISICSQKGGVGKTTTAVNLGSALAHFHGKKVLVVDLDPQGHVEKSLGSLISDGLEYTPLSKVLEGKKGEVLDAVIKTELENFHLTPGDKALTETESILSAKIGKEFILRSALAIAKTHYDYILFDCPPSLGNLTLNALVASNYVLIPCEMSVLAFEGASDLMETLRVVTERINPKLSVLGLLFTRVDGRNVVMNDVIADNMKKFFAKKIFKTRVTINTAINKAQLEGRPVFKFAPSSTGATNYQALSDEVIQRTRSKRPTISA